MMHFLGYLVFFGPTAVATVCAVLVGLRAPTPARALLRTLGLTVLLAVLLGVLLGLAIPEEPGQRGAGWLYFPLWLLLGMAGFWFGLVAGTVAGVITARHLAQIRDRKGKPRSDAAPNRED